MPLIQAQAPNGARSPIQILVAAPKGKVGAPSTEFMRNAADRVAAVEADEDVPLVRLFDEPLHVQQLPRVVHDRGQDDTGDLIRHLLDQHVFRQEATVDGGDNDEIANRIESPELQMTPNRVEVRTKNRL